MNRGNWILPIAGALVAVALFFSGAFAQEKKTRPGEEFFLVSSIDLAKSQLVLMRPTEVTVLMRVTPKTTFVDEKGKAMQVTDLRAGDTVWVASTKGDEETQVALRIRKGPMTLQDLHRIYLDFPQN